MDLVGEKGQTLRTRVDISGYSAGCELELVTRLQDLVLMLFTSQIQRRNRKEILPRVQWG